VLTTTVVGSYPQPSWLIERERLGCGMKYLPRERAFAKVRAMVEGARLVRKELG
jgi:methionine synthase II (cobalamin-independent)